MNVAETTLLVKLEIFIGQRISARLSTTMRVSCAFWILSDHRGGFQPFQSAFRAQIFVLECVCVGVLWVVCTKRICFVNLPFVRKTLSLSVARVFFCGQVRSPSFHPIRVVLARQRRMLQWRHKELKRMARKSICDEAHADNNDGRTLSRLLFASSVNDGNGSSDVYIINDCIRRRCTWKQSLNWSQHTRKCCGQAATCGPIWCMKNCVGLVIDE